MAITGTIAAGKTSLAEAVSAILHERGMRHALLDIDWLGQLYPPHDADDPFSLELAFRNLELIVPNFVNEGADHFVMALTLTSKEELDALRTATPQLDLRICMVTASSATRARRIAARDGGTLQKDFLERTDELDERIRSLRLHDLEIVNDGRALPDIAAEVLHDLGWLPRGQA